MTNRLLIVAILLLLSNVSKSQSTFLKTYQSPEYDSFYSVAETSDNEYIFCGSKEKSPGANFNAYLTKVDISGEPVGEYSLNSVETESGFTFIRKATGSSNFYVSGYENPDDSMNYTKIWEIDEDLSIGSVYYVGFNDTLINTPVNFINLGDSAFYVLSNTWYSTKTSPDISLLKINSDSTYLFYESSQRALRWPSGIIFDSLTNSLKIAYFGNQVKDRSPVTITTFDLDLNITDSFHPEVDIQNLNYGFSMLNDTSWVIVAYTQKMTGDNCLFAAKYHNNSLLDSLELHNNHDTITYSGFGQSVLPLDTCTWIVGIYNIDPRTLWQSDPTWIQLSKLNADFELTDQFYYGGDGSYNPFDIISTTDGGILMTGNYYNPNAVPLVHQRDPFILKVNSDGLIVNIDNPPQPVAQEAIVLPNPGSEFLQVKLAIQHKSAHIQLYDINGRFVLESDLIGDLHKVSTNNLGTGTYIYRITASNRVIGSGKWIKQ